MTNFDYHDKKLGWIIYPVLGISFIFFANDNDFETLIRLPSFKWDVVFSIIASFIIGLYLAWLVRYLDKGERFSWETALSKRVIIQFLSGIVGPLVLALGLEMAYLVLINIDLSQSSVFNLELPLVFLYLFIINVLYYLNYVSVTYRNTLEEKDFYTPIENIEISDGTKSSLMPIQQIAFLKSEDKVLWLTTIEGKRHYLSGTLKDWQEKLPQEYFYRLNRKIIVHRDTIEETEPTETRRLKVFLKHTSDEVYIAKTKVTDFRQWWKR